MKKLFYFILCILIANQLDAKVTLGLGIRGGLTSSKWKNYNLKESGLSSQGGQLSPRIGFGGGIHGRLWFNKFVGLGIGLEFNQAGNERKLQFPAGGNLGLREKYYINKTSYIDVPLTAQVGWGNDRLRIFGVAGGYMGMALKGTDTESEFLAKEPVKEEPETDMDFDNEYNRIDYGIRFGAGIEVMLSKNKKHGLTFDATYDWGLAQIYKDQYANLNSNIKYTNTRTMIHVGYMVKLGGGTNEEKTKEAKVKTEKVKTEKVKEPKTNISDTESIPSDDQVVQPTETKKTEEKVEEVKEKTKKTKEDKNKIKTIE